MWCCVVCRNFFTPEEAGWPAPQDAPIPVRGPRKRGGGTAHPERVRRASARDYPRAEYRATSKAPRRKKTTGDYVLLAAAIGIIIIVGTTVLLGLTGKLG